MSELAEHFLHTLLKTPYMPRADLRRYEDRLAATMIAHAAAHVPFYRDTGRLDGVMRDGQVDMARWTDIPILTRQDARAAGASLEAEQVPEASGDISQYRTSGSTGSSFVFKRSAVKIVASRACNERFFVWHGLDPDGTLAELTVYRADKLVSDWQRRAWRLGTPTGVTRKFIRSDVEPDLHGWLAERRTDYVAGNPNRLGEIARQILAGEASPIRFKMALTHGECLSDGNRADIGKAFGCKVIDRYASQETGFIAAECEHGAYHVACETNRVEIVDEDGRVVPDGTSGRVVLTSLYNFAMPLIRYAIGDHATLSPVPCRCGRNLPVLQSILGRESQIFTFADGTRQFPYISYYEMRQIVPYRQLQLVQRAPDLVDLVYVPENDAPIDAERVTAFIHRYLRRGDLRVTLTPVTEIPRLASGKFSEYVSLLGPH